MKYFRTLLYIIIFINISVNQSVSSTCSNKILDVKTTYVPDEFQANVILNSFLKDQIIEDLTSWFTKSHFPFGDSTAWHKINLETTTIDLSSIGFNEQLLIIYYQSQNYCGIGGQCSSYLLRNINNEWKKIDHWHEVKWELIYVNDCEPNTLNIKLEKDEGFSQDEPNHGRLIEIDMKG
tara:strand:+ start:128 stop:664 length:537 start_codon:yes stop_codon:yes gene_type:complete